MNTFKTGLLMAAITALFVIGGYASGGSSGMVIAVVLAAIMNIGTFWFSDKLVIKMTGAIPLARHEAPDLHQMVERLSERANIPTPKLYLVPDPSPNAFATGRSPKHGVVAVNQGLLDILTHDEVEGVIAHEIAHIKHRDTLTSAVAATMAGAISSIANIAMFTSMFGGHSDEDRPHPLVMLLTMIVAPLAAMLIQMGISRTREFAADRTAAELTGSPRGLQNALLKLERGSQAIPSHSMNQSTAHMAIVNPLAGGQMLASLFSTHPPIEVRVRKLGELEGR